jgi:hypothetical protein
MSKRKKKPRSRRYLTPVERRTVSVEEESVSRFKRASTVATTLGAVALGAALLIQYKILPFDLGASGITILKVAGGGLVIAGFIFGRGAKTKG